MPIKRPPSPEAKGERDWLLIICIGMFVMGVGILVGLELFYTSN